MTKLAATFVMLASMSGCNKKQEEKLAPQPTPGSAAVQAPAVDAAAAAPAWDGKTPLSITEGFSTPESVLYDADADVYLVSNINGKPLDADDNGFITKISAEGKITEAKWIDGAKDSIKLDAPKGMAISGGSLWIADRTVVRKFDAKTGEPQGDVTIDGAAFLNDVAAAPDGGVYVTDSGIDATFTAVSAGAIYQIDKDHKVKALTKDKTLGNPNGIAADNNGRVWVVTMGTGEIYQVDAKGKKQAAQKLPNGQLDGVVTLGGGDLLVSSWEGMAIVRGKPGGEWKAVVENVKSPADIGYDHKRKRVLIPVFQGNTVIIHPLE